MVGFKNSVDMKKLNYYLGAALSVVLCAASCQKENELAPSQKNEKISVIVSLGDQTKGFSDTKGVTWEVGDQIKFADDGGVKFTSAELTSEQIFDNGHTAKFTFDASLIAADRTGWFCSTKCHPTNATEVEFTLGADNGNVFIQDEAGEMNKRYLFLHSGTGLVSIKAGVKPTITMDVAGTILRVLPYTSKYNDEKVLSVKFESNDKVVGTVGYDRGKGTYKSVTDVNWKLYNFVQANLGTAFSLEGVTSAETSKGIYMAIPATKADAPLNGYKYTVETDKATYIFDAMDKTMAVGNNVVKNVYLNLDKGVKAKGYLKYDGALTLSIVPADGFKDQDAGYWKAMVSTDGNIYEDRLNAENSAFYSDVQFTYTDPSTGASVDWISVKYGGSDLCHWLVTAKENTGEERKVKITATFSNVGDYAIETGSKTKELTLTQRAAGSNKKLSFFGGIGDATIEAKGVTKKDLGYCVIDVDGTHAEDWSGDSHNEDLLYGSVTITPYVLGTGVGAGATVADWLTVGYGKDSEGNFNSTHIYVTAQDNLGAERKALVYCEYIAPDGYEFNGGEKSVYKQFIVTQKKADVAIEATLSNVYAETVLAAGATITAATLALTVNGAKQDDVEAAITTYGLSVTADKGATASVAADGTVTLTVPENKYKNGGITYTLSVKSSSGTLLDSANITQAEGTEESGSASHTFSYTIFNNAENGSKATGFGKAAGSVGDWYRAENITIDGTKYGPGQGQGMKDLCANEELINALIAQIFSFGEITSEDVQVPGNDPLTTNPESFVKLEAWSDGGAAVYFRIVFLNENTTGARRTFKIITKGADGNVTSTIVYFQNA